MFSKKEQSLASAGIIQLLACSLYWLCCPNFYSNSNLDSSKL